MSDDYEFISNVKALATNGTLIELLRRLEEDCVRDWKAARELDKREECWHALSGIRALTDKISSLANDEKVRDFYSRKPSKAIKADLWRS